MHPVVIMSFDKSPAITKAVAVLEEAGMEVVVLNTGTAKLVEFLGALAGEDGEIEDLPSPTEPKDEPESDEEVPVDVEDEKPLATEALVNGEKVIVQIVEGDELMLHSSNVVLGAKTFYRLNESEFSFWTHSDTKFSFCADGDTKDTMESANAPISCAVEIQIGELKKYVPVFFSEEAMDPPVLRIGREWFKSVGV